MTTLNLTATGAGDNTEWPSQSPSSGAHWDKIAADGADFIYIGGKGDTYYLDLFTATPSVMGGQISNVRVTVKVFQYGGSAYIKCAVKTHGTTYYGTETSIAGLDWSPDTYYYNWATNPNTAAQWTWSEVYAMQFGIAGKKTLGGESDEICYYVYATVTYTESTSSTNVPVGDFGIF